MVLNYLVQNKNLTLKAFLKQHNFSNRLLAKLKNKGAVLCNGNNVFMNYALFCNDIITVNLDYDEDNDNIVPTKTNLDIVYEDDAFLIINKPAGIPVHPSLHYYGNSISNGVKYYFNKIGLNKKIRPVNRLDKDTSGLVVFAKNEYIQECLIRQMQNNQFKKEYIALLDGILEQKEGTINAPIARKEKSIIERCISDDGDTAITHYQVLEEYDCFSLVNFLLETGRTHQIRVHSKYIGHSILGDTLYGEESELIRKTGFTCI